MSDFEIIGKVVIDDANATAALKSGLGGIEEQAGSTGAAIEGMGGATKVAGEEAEKTAAKHGKLSSMFSDMTGKGAGLNKSLGVLAGTFAGGFVALEAGKWLLGGISDAAKMQQATDVLNRTLEQNAHITPQAAKGVDEWGDKLARTYGISHEQVLPDLGVLTASTKNVAESEKLMGDAADIAAARHLPLDSVVKALAKGAQGTTTGLSRLGLATKDAGGNALTFTQIMKEAVKAYGGDAAAAADTTAGRMAVLQESYSQTKDRLMTDLIPAENALLTGLTAVFNYLPTLASGFATAWRDVIGPVVMWAWDNVLHPVFDMIVFDVKAQIAVDELLAEGVMWAWKTVIGPTVTFVWQNILKPVGLAIEADVRLQIQVIKDLATWTTWAWTNVIGPVVRFAWNNILKPVWEQGIMPDVRLMSTLVQTLGGIFKTAFGAIQTAVQDAWKVVKPIFDGIEKGLGLIGKAASAVSGLFGSGHGSSTPQRGGPSTATYSSGSFNSATWAQDFLKAAGLPVTSQNIANVNAWENAEGTFGHINNPLDTTQSAPGAHSINSAGVKDYTSLTQGLSATVSTLFNGYYTAIINALKGSVSTSAFEKAVGSTPWGTFDSGGWLPAGGIGVNKTNKPEAVLTQQQLTALTTKATEYHLHIHTASDTVSPMQEFAMMKTLAAVS